MTPVLKYSNSLNFTLLSYFLYFAEKSFELLLTPAIETISSKTKVSIYQIVAMIICAIVIPYITIIYISNLCKKLAQSYHPSLFYGMKTCSINILEFVTVLKCNMFSGQYAIFFIRFYMDLLQTILLLYIHVFYVLYIL